MKPYLRPVYDPIFKHLMHYEDLRNNLIGNLIGEKIISSTILDEALNPLPMYKELRNLVNQSRIEELMQGFENIDPCLLKVDSPDRQIRSLLAGAVDFVKALAPKYYQLTRAVPCAERETKMDIVCKTETEFINVDVQLQPQNYWDVRILDHICGLFHRQFKRGFEWSDLEKGLEDGTIRRSIGISILDQAPKYPEKVTEILPWYNATPWANDELKRVFRLREENDPGKIRPGIEFYDFNLRALYILQNRHELGEYNEELIEWLDFLANANQKSHEDVAHVKSEIVQKAYSVIDELPKEVEQKGDEFVKTQYNIYSHYIDGTVEEKKDGWKAEGREEGKIEGKIETAKNLLSMNLGMTLEQIAQAAGLSISEVEQIAREMKENK